LVSSDSEDLESLVVWADDLMKKVLQELTSLKRKVEAISNTPVEVSGNVEQLTKLHNELMWERQAKKIYPDRDFEKEHDQNDYNTCKDVVRLLSYVDSSLLPFDQQEALAKALKWLRGVLPPSSWAALRAGALPPTSPVMSSPSVSFGGRMPLQRRDISTRLRTRKGTCLFFG